MRRALGSGIGYGLKEHSRCFILQGGYSFSPSAANYTPDARDKNAPTAQSGQ